MSNFNQDADMQPAPQFGGRGGFRGRGYQQQTFDSPFGGPSQHRGGRGGGFRGNGGYQQNYNNRGRGNWQPRGGRGRGGGGEYRGRDGGGGYGGGRGRGRGGGGGFPRPEEKSSVPARAYVMPAMTRNPWELLEKQYEAELAARKAASSQ